MVLDLKQIQEILEKPSKQQIIKKAVSLEKRIRFHTEPNVEQRHIYAPVTEFLNWVRAMLPKDKYSTFLQLFKLPSLTIPVVDSIYEELERVFYSKNYSSSYRFTSSELLEDWQHYRENKLNEPDIWKTEGWKNVKVHPNSILVVDMPVEQLGQRPEPYFYWLDVADVIDYNLNRDGSFSWVVFKQPNLRIAVFDSESIRVFQLNEKREIVGLVSESTHGLGYCTARFFWHSPITNVEPGIKENPIAKELADLDWYLFFAISKRHLDLYAPYPIYSAYEADCNFENNETGDYCDGGFLRNIKGDYKILADGSLERCPKCGEKRIAGPGSFLEVPVPNQTEGVADMRNPVQITTIDRESLDYNVEELERLREEIKVNVVGSNGKVSEKEAINETQVAANFESKTSVLIGLKTNFELAQKFVEDTICRLRYGNEFISSSINWGTEFYVYSVNDLYKKYKLAKETGASYSELDSISQQILEVEYKNNPIMFQRMMILKQLEPYSNLTFDELSQLNEQGIVDDKKLIIKYNFTSYIQRFERENIDIVEFASALPMNEKIKRINEKLLDYANEERSTVKGNKVAGFTGVQN